jgi:tyrosine-protein phosphatase YwqE
MHLLHEDQAYSNHGQTLKRLKERGGLGVTEILAIIHRKKWAYYGNMKWEEALKMLNDILNKEAANG